MSPADEQIPGQEIVPSASTEPVATVPPAFERPQSLTGPNLRVVFAEAHHSWLAKSPSFDTRRNYARDVEQFLAFLAIPRTHVEQLARILPHQVAAWRDHLHARGLTNSSIARKMSALRSLYSYLQTYGYTGANPAHSDFVEAPAVPRDGKTVALTPQECRILLEAPSHETAEGIRDRALIAVLAYTGCRVGELCRLRVCDYKSTGTHRILEVQGKGGKERRVALHIEAVERLEQWLAVLPEREGAIFRPTRTARGRGRDGFMGRAMSRRAVEYLIERYVQRLGFDPAVTVHSLRVTALTTARERGCDIVDLQDFAGHADPRTTLAYIRNRDRLSRSPAYVLKF